MLDSELVDLLGDLLLGLGCVVHEFNLLEGLESGKSNLLKLEERNGRSRWLVVDGDWSVEVGIDLAKGGLIRTSGSCRNSS